ncbi:MAG: TIGR03000 domain-containing protein [Planctomycetota bacterium]|nr:TIGR03000 domain-containing protein [Planctomycetota bacterium]
MRNKLVRWLSGAAVVASFAAFAGLVSAGYGSSGSYGGYASSYGSSGGSAGYGSSGGYTAGYGSSGGYTAGYGSSGVASYGGSSGGYVGPLRRLHNHIHDGIHNRTAARAAARSYGSSGGSSGVLYSSSYGSSGGSSGGSYPSGGSSGGGSSGGSYLPSYSHGSSGGGSSGGGSSGGGSSGSYIPTYSGGSSGSIHHYGSYDGVIMDSSVPMSSNASGVLRSSNKVSTSQSFDPREIHLVVNLPEDAKMFVNGNATTSTGTSRHFISRNLNEGESYRFELKAVLADANGNEVQKTKTVVLNSGNGEEINFDMQSNDEPTETVLTLKVPEDASVILANNVTKNSGSARVFRTKQLRNGESWDDYKIQVTVAGVTKEKVIRLIGGDNLELTFNFDDAVDAKLAMQ